MIGPWVSHTDPVAVEVTSAQSNYSLRSGLKINKDEPFDLFAENFLRVGETRNDVTPVKIHLDSESCRIRVDHDSGQPTPISMGISLDRTLRVPEDGVRYNMPTLFSPFPVVQVKDHVAMLPSGLQGKGGLLIPMYQREAIALTFRRDQCGHQDFAMKVLAGGVNSTTGDHRYKTPEEAKDKAQDYVVLPKQTRLDGYASDPGIVRQFVSMPLGLGYTAEGQLTGKEVLGGFQLVIAPRRKSKSVFQGVSHQFCSPKEDDFPVGSYICFQGEDLHERSRSLSPSVQLHSMFQLQESYWLYSTLRPITTLEAVRKLTHSEKLSACSLNNITLEPIFVITIAVSMESPDRFDTMLRKDSHTKQEFDWVPSQGALEVEACLSFIVSPFIDVTHFHEMVKKRVETDQIILFLEDEEMTLPGLTVYAPLAHFIKNSSNLVCRAYQVKKSIIPKSLGTTKPSLDERSEIWLTRRGVGRILAEERTMMERRCEGSDEDRRRIVAEERMRLEKAKGARTLGKIKPRSPQVTQFPAPGQPSVSSWEMGLAAGGRILQDVLRDDEKNAWNWHHACFINIQIVNSVIFERLTGVSTPATPITFRNYIEARIPFHHVLGTNAVIGNDVLEDLKSVSEHDQSRGVVHGTCVTKNNLPLQCVVCEKMLADSILQPCNHIFCSSCIKDTMAISSQRIFCAACQKESSNVISIAAPMEAPQTWQPTRKSTQDEAEPNLDDWTQFWGATKKKRKKPRHAQYQSAQVDASTQTMTNAGEVFNRTGTAAPHSEKLESATGNTISPAFWFGPRSATKIDDEHEKAILIGSTDSLNQKNPAGLQVALRSSHPQYRPWHSGSSVVRDEQEAFARSYTRQVNRGRNPSFSLVDEVYHGDLHNVKRLLVDGHDPNMLGNIPVGFPEITDRPEFQPESLAHIAARLGHGNILYALHEAGADLNVPGSLPNWMPIHEACAAGQNAVLLLLLMLGVSIDTEYDGRWGNWRKQKRGKRKFTPLIVAARNGRLTTIKLLIKHGAKCEMDTDRWQPWPSALHVAARNDDLEVVRFLLTKLPANLRTCSYPKPPLSEAVEYAQLEVMRCLIAAGADVNAYDYPWNILGRAAISGSYEAVAILLEAGADTEPDEDHCNSGYHSVLHAAAVGGSREIIDRFLDLGLDANYRDPFRARTRKPYQLPVSEALRHGHLECCEALISRGAVVEAADLNLSHIFSHDAWKTLYHWAFLDFCSLLTVHNAKIDRLQLIICKLLTRAERSTASTLMKHHVRHSAGCSIGGRNDPDDLDELAEIFVEMRQVEALGLLIEATRQVRQDDTWPRTCGLRWSACINNAIRAQSFDMIDVLLANLPTEEAQRAVFRFARWSNRGESAKARYVRSYMLKRYTDGDLAAFKTREYRSRMYMYHG